MAEAVVLKDIADELKAIREDLDYIKEHMVDVDMTLTKDEEERLEESLREYKDGKVISLEDFERKIDK